MPLRLTSAKCPLSMRNTSNPGNGRGSACPRTGKGSRSCSCSSRTRFLDVPVDHQRPSSMKVLARATTSHGPARRRSEQNPATREQQDQTDARQPMSCRHGLLEQDQQGQPDDPGEVHDPADEQEKHQEPAAADTVRAMHHPHAQGAGGPASPMLRQEMGR